MRSFVGFGEPRIVFENLPRLDPFGRSLGFFTSSQVCAGRLNVTIGGGIGRDCLIPFDLIGEKNNRARSACDLFESDFDFHVMTPT